MNLAVRFSISILSGDLTDNGDWPYRLNITVSNFAGTHQLDPLDCTTVETAIGATVEAMIRELYDLKGRK